MPPLHKKKRRRRKLVAAEAEIRLSDQRIESWSLSGDY